MDGAGMAGHSMADGMGRTNGLQMREADGDGMVLPRRNLHRCVDRQVGRWVDGWAVGQADRRVDGQQQEQMNVSRQANREWQIQRTLRWDFPVHVLYVICLILISARSPEPLSRECHHG